MSVAIEVWKHPSGNIQVSIGEVGGGGFRLAGISFDGQGERIAITTIKDHRTIGEIRRYLDIAERGLPCEKHSMVKCEIRYEGGKP